MSATGTGHSRTDSLHSLRAGAVGGDSAPGVTPGRALLLACVVVLVVLIAMAYVWYHYTGWEKSPLFTSAGYDPTLTAPECTPTKGEPIQCVNGRACCGKVGGVNRTFYTCYTDNDCPAGSLPFCAKGICVSEKPPSWDARPGADGQPRTVDRLRFKNSVFTVTSPDGSTTYRRDVTAVLNGMAAAYKNSSVAPPTTLSLDRPLNAFSFTIPGFNDVNSMSADQVPAWAGASATLETLYRTI